MTLTVRIITLDGPWWLKECFGITPWLPIARHTFLL